MNKENVRLIKWLLLIIFIVLIAFGIGGLAMIKANEDSGGTIVILSMVGMLIAFMLASHLPTRRGVLE